MLEFPNHKLVLQTICQMELYLLLGVVNHLYKNICDLWPIPKECLTALHILVQPYQGGHFNENGRMELLRGISKRN